MKRINSGPRVSSAVVAQGIVHLTGVVSKSGADTSTQTQEVLDRIDEVLELSGSHKTKVMSCTIVLPDLADFDAMNVVYDAWLEPENVPARSTFQGNLVDPTAKVEIIVVASV